MIENPETGALEAFNFDQLQENVPELKRFNYRISSYQFNPPIDSSDMEPSLWAKLVKIIEYNYEYFRDRVINTKNVTTDGDINKAVKEEIAKQKEKLPYRIAIKREDPEDLESIVIESITSVKSNDQEDLPVNMLKLHVQTLEARERHWLDTGIIDL